MTRINLVHPSELHRKHLQAEYHELVRVFALARNAQHEMHKKKQPAKYTLGTGHVLFFYDKLKFISERYDMLCQEMQHRGFACNRVPKAELHAGIAQNMFWDYNPTPEAIALNRARIQDRLPKE